MSSSIVEEGVEADEDVGRGESLLPLPPPSAASRGGEGSRWRTTSESSRSSIDDRERKCSSDALSKSAVILVDQAEHRKERVPLNTSWTFWLDKSCKGYTQADYEAALRKIYTVRTVEGFWSVYNNIPSVEKLQSSCSYHLMRHEIRPLWEDEANQDGGTWRLKCRKTESVKVWKEMLLACIGEQLSSHLHEEDDLLGVTIAVRDRDDLIQIWNRESSLAEDQKILQTIQSFVPEVEFIASFYKPHQTHHAYQDGSRSASAAAASSKTASSSSGIAAPAGGSALSGMAMSASLPAPSMPRQIPPPGFQSLLNQPPPSSPIRLPPFPAMNSSPRVSSLPMNIAGGNGLDGNRTTYGGSDALLGTSPFGRPPPQIPGNSPLFPPGCSPHVPPPNWNNKSQNLSSDSFKGILDFGSLSKFFSSSPHGGASSLGSSFGAPAPPPPFPAHLHPLGAGAAAAADSHLRSSDASFGSFGSPQPPGGGLRGPPPHHQMRSDSRSSQEEYFFARESIDEEDEAVLAVGSPPIARPPSSKDLSSSLAPPMPAPGIFGSPPGCFFGGGGYGSPSSGTSPAAATAAGLSARLGPPPGFGTSPNVGGGGGGGAGSAPSMRLLGTSPMGVPPPPPAAPPGLLGTSPLAGPPGSYGQSPRRGGGGGSLGIGTSPSMRPLPPPSLPPGIDLSKPPPGFPE